MKHRILTCKNHPDLRWSCKDIAWTEGYGYNGMRHIFFNGKTTGQMYSDKSGVDCTPAVECNCSPRDLVIAPEDTLVRP